MSSPSYDIYEKLAKYARKYSAKMFEMKYNKIDLESKHT